MYVICIYIYIHTQNNTKHNHATNNNTSNVYMSPPDFIVLRDERWKMAWGLGADGMLTSYALLLHILYMHYVTYVTYVCMNVYMYVCMYVCIVVCMHACMYVCN